MQLRTHRLITFAFLLFPASLLARWATLEDSPAVSLLDNSTITIEEDGSSHEEHESLIEIRNEEGRSLFGTSSFKYNPKTTRILNLHAETRAANGTVYPVPSQFIEDKPLASSADGFDENHQISIAYPHATAGARLYVKFSRENFKTPLQNFYSDEFYFGLEYFEKNTQIEIKSKLPLFTQVNDPHHHLAVTNTREQAFYDLKIHLNDSVFTKVIDEEEDSLNHFDKTWIYVSTERDITDVGKSVTPAYEAILGSPLPPLFQSILETAQKQSKTLDQINTVTSLLADEIRYMGDWREIHGGHIPRALDVIATTRFGDCKDYSVSAAAIFRKLGMEAYVAWIERDLHPTPFPDIALDSAFNHAIIKVVHDKKTYWVDPTNYSSYAQGVFEDLLDRPALVLDPRDAYLDYTPKGDPKDSRVKKDFSIYFDHRGDATIQAELDYFGRAATSLAGLSRELSKESINHLLSKAIAGDGSVEKTELEEFQLDSRVTKDVQLRGRVKVRNLAMKTTAGNAYSLARGVLGQVVDVEAYDRVSDLPLDSPQEEHTVYRLKSVRLVGNQPTSCYVQSPWLTAARHFRKEGKDFIIADDVEIKKLTIPVKDIHSETFSTLQDTLQRCFNQFAVVFQGQ